MVRLNTTDCDTAAQNFSVISDTQLLLLIRFKFILIDLVLINLPLVKRHLRNDVWLVLLLSSNIVETCGDLHDALYFLV